MAKFKVTTPDGETEYEGRFTVETGVLSIYSQTGTPPELIYSPSAWLSVEVSEMDRARVLSR
jgi:hypothetical protein